MAIQLSSLISGNIKIFSLPSIFLRLNDVINDLRSSVTDIGNLISEDQGLTVRMLKLANSPLYGFPSKIETISKAVLVIGTKQIRDLSLATSIIRVFEGIPEEFITMESFWRHSIACGVIARIIAGYRREPNVETFFTAGILHDIGRLIMYTKIPAECRNIFSQVAKQPQLLFKAEREQLGFNHTDVGGLLLKEWKLPQNLTEAIACHHNPDNALQYPVEAAIIHIADILAHAMQLGSSGEKYVPRLSEGAWAKLSFPTSMLPFLFKQGLQHADIAMQIVLPAKK
ncbi:MAG: HDOD domain-containing protein [Dissulfurispiraceae bacterium]|jgi:putative nucleotidyltransferase with HDIG domain